MENEENQNDIQIMDARVRNKNMTIAYSIQEQKRGNDISEKWLRTIQIMFFLLLIFILILYWRLDTLNFLSGQFCQG